MHATDSPKVPTLPLAGGGTMPAIGLGTWPMDDAQAETTVADAIRAGWRLIDTAENYRNETGVGRGIAAAGVPRERLFVTTKFNKQWHGLDGPAQALDASLRRLGLDYVDLLLIHWPVPQQDRFVDAFRGLLRLRDEGRIRAVGTSNFPPALLQRLGDETGRFPQVNQVQMSPLHVRDDWLEFHRTHGIVTEAWSPIARGPALLDADAVRTLAQAHGRTPAQIVLRWHVQRGVVPIPKTTDAQRLRENLDVFDFALSGADMAALSALDGRDGAPALDPATFGH